MNQSSLIIIGMLAAASIIAFLIARRALQSMLGSRWPAPLAALAVASLGVMGVLHLGEGPLKALLIPYAALTLALPGALILLCLAPLLKSRPRNDQRQAPPSRQPERESDRETNAARRPDAGRSGRE
jgi:hypothetical protein